LPHGAACRSSITTERCSTCPGSGPRSTFTSRSRRRSARRSRLRPREHLVTLCERDGIEFHPTAVPGKLAEELFDRYVVPSLMSPTFVMDYPVDTSPLVRAHRTKPGVVEKWDLYINGMESGTGYSELIDPVIQRERLVEQSALAERGDVEAMHVDEDFLRAMEHGMPPMGGVGVGVDRMLMALTGLGIRETILFPLVKPERFS
jgi:lysyl-tRNA synthetase class 2